MSGERGEDVGLTRALGVIACVFALVSARMWDAGATGAALIALIPPAWYFVRVMVLAWRETREPGGPVSEKGTT